MEAILPSIASLVSGIIIGISVERWRWLRRLRDIDAAERRRFADLARALGRESLPTGQTGKPSVIRPADMRRARTEEGDDLQQF